MNIVFTEDQQAAYDAIINFIDNGSNYMALLEGCAGCLAGSTQLLYRRGKKTNGRYISIEELYKKFNNLDTNNKWRIKNVPTFVKSLTSDNIINYNELIDIWCSGVKDVYKLTTVNGRTLFATDTHPVLTINGYIEMGKLTKGDTLLVQGSMLSNKSINTKGRKKREIVYSLKYYKSGSIHNVRCPLTGSVRQYKRTDKARLVVESVMNNISYEDYLNNLRKNPHYIYDVLDSEIVVHHIDGNPSNNDISNLQTLSKLEHDKLHATELNFNKEYVEKDIVDNIIFHKTEQTYDIEMKSPNNNYIIDNGIIVHNSGKSTLCSAIVDYVVNHGLFGKIAMCAPTNKAVKVVKSMVDPLLKDKIDFTSLHSLLGLKHLITKDGKEIFKRDSKSPCKLSFYDLVIVDEASMVSDELFNEIENQNYRGTKVLFVGDSNQINPINHTHAIPMLAEKRELFNIEHYKLTKIVRQAEGNPIIVYSQKILKNEFKMIPGHKDMVDKTGVVMLNGDKQILRNLLNYYFCSEAFDKNPNHAKLVAWTNNTVDMFNSIIRSMKYGKAPKIVLGEKLIVDKPIKDSDDEIIFTTNEDLVVLSIEEKEKTLSQGKFSYYDCLVRGDEDQEHYIRILHEKSQRNYDMILRNLSSMAVKETDIKKKITAWKNYYGFMENFALVNYNYALTVHCAQGSTYDNCFVVYNDIMRNHREDERKRILYTSVTRPRNLLYIL